LRFSIILMNQLTLDSLLLKMSKNQSTIEASPTYDDVIILSSQSSKQSLSPTPTIMYELGRSDTMVWMDDDYEWADRQVFPPLEPRLRVDTSHLPLDDGEWRPKRPLSWFVR
jgi:hypothetical protein